MKKFLISFTTILAMFVFCGCNKNTTSTTAAAVTNQSTEFAPNPEGLELTATEVEMIEAVNKYRQEKGLSILKVCKNLADGAKQQSDLMQEKGEQQHYLADANGAKAEITLMKFHTDASTAIDTFKKSTAHNSVMLKSEYTCIGAGVTSPGYWTLRFE